MLMIGTCEVVHLDPLTGPTFVHCVLQRYGKSWALLFLLVRQLAPISLPLVQGPSPNLRLWTRNLVDLLNMLKYQRGLGMHRKVYEHI